MRIWRFGDKYVPGADIATSSVPDEDQATSPSAKGVSELVSHPHRSPGRTFAQALLSLELLVIGGLAVVTALVALYQVVLELAGEHGHFPRGEYFTYGLVVAVLVVGGVALRATRLLQQNEGQALRLLGIVAITFLVLFALSRQRPEMTLVSVVVGIIAVLHIVGATAVYTAFKRWFVRAPERVLRKRPAIVGIIISSTSGLFGFFLFGVNKSLNEGLSEPLSGAELARSWAILVVPALIALLGCLVALARFGGPGRFLVMLGALGMVSMTVILFAIHPIAGLIMLIPPGIMVKVAMDIAVPGQPNAEQPSLVQIIDAWRPDLMNGQGRRHW